MDFSDVLNGYIEQLGCSAKELSDASHVSPAVISRYRSGERIPSVGGAQLSALAEGVEELSQRLPGAELSRDDVLAAFMEAITGINVDYPNFLDNLNALVAALNLSNNELAHVLSFDPSYISRILTGQRHPADMPQFVSVVSQYAARRCSEKAQFPAIAQLTGCSIEVVRNEALCARAIAVWLGSNIDPQADSLTDFLRKLDKFDLNEFTRTLQFSEESFAARMNPTPAYRTYAGIDEMMEAELDFLRTVVLSRSNEDIIMYSDLPIDNMADHDEFPKKWLFYMAMIQSRGLHLHIIHDVSRPFREMLVGLENWIPLYMTGQVSPYYLGKSQSDIFCHLIRSAGTVTLAGEAIVGHQDEGRYVLTKRRADVDYYRLRAQRLLERAHPLIDIYRKDRQEELESFIGHMTSQNFSRRILLSGLPVSTASPDLLERILSHNEVPDADRERIFEYAKWQRKTFVAALESAPLRLEVPEIDEPEIREHPLMVPLSCIFYEGDIVYSYEEYQEHIELTKQFVANYPNCTLQLNPHMVFRNIEIAIHEGECAIISKNKAPAAHFVIRNPNMLTALENFVPPIVDPAS